MAHRAVTTPDLVSPSVTDYLKTPPPALTTPWRQAGFCVIDLELTGLDPSADSIVSFAALQIAGGRLRLSDLRYQLVRPTRMPEAETIRIHGLRGSDLVDAPALEDVLDDLLEALTGNALVAHVDALEPQTVGSLQRYANHSRDWSPPQALRRLLGRVSREQ